MGLLTDVEHALEGFFEGAVARAFPTKVQPIDLMRALEVALEDAVLVERDEALAPNAFTVRMNEDTARRFEGARERLQLDCERHLLHVVAQRRFDCVAPITVRLCLDTTLTARPFKIDADFSGAPEPQPVDHANAGVAETTIAMPITATPVWTLQISGPTAKDEIVTLAAEHYMLGRGEESDIRLSEPAVSRRHAVLRREGDCFILEDLGSTNGLSINGRWVRGPCEVQDGDVLLIGTTQLVMHRHDLFSEQSA